MRGFSSVASIAAHCGLAAALLFGTAETVRPDPIRVVPIAVLPSQPRRVIEDPGTWAPPSPADLSIQVDRIPLLKLEIGGSATQATVAPFSASVPSSPGSASIVGWVDLGSENGPQVLSGPLPSYPELLRQAGVEGRVVLEAIVEATGRVRRDSIPSSSPSKTAGDTRDEPGIKGSSGCHRFVMFDLLATETLTGTY